MESTSLSLLQQLRQPHAEAAWARFCRQYAGPLLRYARKLGLDEADAQDVLQESLLVLMRCLPGFTYDPARGRFRNFVLTIVHRQALGLLRRRQRRAEVELPDLDVAASPPAVDDRWRDALLDEAWSRLRQSGTLQERTVQVFEAYAMRGEEAEVVAKNFGLTANTVYQIRNRVIAQLREVVHRLLVDFDPDASRVWASNP